MKTSTTAAIIDIGSNTVRLAVYQWSGSGAYRIVDQGRWAAQLSRKMDSDGTLVEEAVRELADVLNHYHRICRMHGTETIRTVATAAIRAAANRDKVVRRLYEETGLAVDILPGEEEARFGSLAMKRTLSIADGYVVDIGGGSTEITLLRNRQPACAVSFPIGCVNTAGKYGLDDSPVPPSVIERIQHDAMRLFASQSWLSANPGLPLIGLGGTVRAFAKMKQRETDYPFPHLHGYEQSVSELQASLERLSSLSVSGRRKLPGLSKDRADVIVPGMAILRAIMHHTRSDRLIVCGTGIRDGLFFETCLPDVPDAGENPVLEISVRNLHELYPTAPPNHLEQVRRMALSLYDSLHEDADFPDYARRCLETAARLYKLGAAIDLNDYADHTFYMLLHTHWYGLPHRLAVLTAAIASYRSVNGNRRRLAPYRSLLQDGDIELAARLGSLLQLSAALDRSESQAIRDLRVEKSKNKLALRAISDHSLAMERMETEALAKDFKKVWGAAPALIPL